MVPMAAKVRVVEAAVRAQTALTLALAVTAAMVLFL
jgi:hypothetical protein